MPYVSGFDCNQLMCCSWDAFVDKESIAENCKINLEVKWIIGSVELDFCTVADFRKKQYRQPEGNFP